MAGEDTGLDQRRAGEHMPWREGRWPVLLATGVALAGPVFLVLFPSQLMFWVMWLLMVPLLLLWTYVIRKTENEGRDTPVDPEYPKAHDVWWPPPDL